jgi:predicted nucleotidyltransferase
MYLDKLLGSKTKVNLLSVLVSRPRRTIIESELAKEAGVSVSEANRQMTDLVSVGLISLERVGKLKMYQVNQSHFLYEPLRTLFRTLEEIYREIAYNITTFVTETSEVKAIILFGSLASGKIREDFVKEPSDIDMVILVEDKNQIEPIKKTVKNYASSKIFPMYGVNAYPIVLSTDEYLSGLSKDTFIMNVHSSGEVLYGEKPRRYG